MEDQKIMLTLEQEKNLEFCVKFDWVEDNLVMRAQRLTIEAGFRGNGNQWGGFIYSLKKKLVHKENQMPRRIRRC